MQKPPKKRARRPAKRSTLLLGMLLLLAAGAAFLLIARQRAAAPKEIPSQPNTRAVLFAYEENQVERVEVETRDYGGYQLVRSDGELRLVGDPEAKLDATLLKAILADCAAIAIEDTLKEDWREEEGPTLAQLGLDPPRVRVSVWYDTGEKAAFSVGDKAPMREAYYFLMDNDSRLYLAGSRYLTDFELDERTLLDTPSPTLDANRMNAIAFTDESGNLTAAWERRDELGWRVTAPVSYPAQEDAMEKVCANIAGIRLGVHIAQAGDADLAA